MKTKEEFVREACVAKAAVDSGIDLNAYAFGVEYGYASQAAEIKRLRDALNDERVKNKHLSNELSEIATHKDRATGLARGMAWSAYNALNPQESEVSNG